LSKNNGEENMISRESVKRCAAHAGAVLLAASIAAPASAQADYPQRPVRMVIPFAPGGASGLVSRRPARGEDAGAAGFYRVAAVTSESYPARPIRMIVPFAPGGASDFVGRIIQPKMSEELGQQVVIDNRTGAAGNIGVEVAARANPDGYTILLGNVGTMAINPGLYVKFAIKPVNDLIAITQVVDVPGSLVVHPSLPVNNVKELVAYAKVRQGQLNFGSPGTGSANQLEMEFFMRATGIRMTHVPYKGGAGPAAIALLGNEVQLMFVTLSSSISFIKQGRMRALGIVAPKRVVAVADVPTMAEAGFPSMTVGSWQGVFVPKGAPRDIVKKLHTVVVKVMEDANVKKRLGDGGVDAVISGSPEAFGSFVKAENERWAKVIKDAGVVPE
jgi:tripartite-type tricarboxylate transporter receptor subunit TctC